MVENTPMTAEIAAKLNSERTQGNWFVEGYRRWICPSTHEARDLPIIQSDASPFDIGFIIEGYKATQPNSDFIANAPAVYDAYIEMAKVQKELVEALKKADTFISAMDRYHGWECTHYDEGYKVECGEFFDENGYQEAKQSIEALKKAGAL